MEQDSCISVYTIIQENIILVSYERVLVLNTTKSDSRPGSPGVESDLGLDMANTQSGLRVSKEVSHTIGGQGLSKYLFTRRYGGLRPPTSSSCGGLVAFGHLEGPSGPPDPTPSHQVTVGGS